MRDASAGLETTNSGCQDIDFGDQQVVLGADQLHAGTADSFLYGRPSPPPTHTARAPPTIGFLLSPHPRGIRPPPFIYADSMHYPGSRTGSRVTYGTWIS